MTREEIMAGLKEVLAMVKPKLDQSAITEDASVVRDLGIDSLSMLLMSLGIETKFGFHLQTQKPFEKVSEVIDYIEKTV